MGEAPTRRVMSGIFSDGRDGLRRKVAGIYAVLVTANVAAWCWALMSFRDNPVLLGTALVAYGFGLRHAVDADHIAAIDNVTRKLLQDGRRPVAVGFFFSLGHSTVVVLASAAIAIAAAGFRDRLSFLQNVGGVVGTLVSAGFLLIVAIMNMVVLLTVYRTFKRVKGGAAYQDQDPDVLLSGGGLLSRLFRPLFNIIRSSWQLYPLGFLFGLGFDTATEIGLLGISASEASHGTSVWAIMIFPALFTAGMSLVDTTDGILMLGAYGWAFVKPLRKLHYNITITFVSVVVALLVGGIEVLGLAVDKFSLKGLLWDGIAALNANFGMIGYLIIAVFAVSWIASAAIYRARAYDRPETG